MDSSKELHIEFKKTNSQAAGVTMKNRVLSVENQLIPTLFDINLSVRKVQLRIIHMLSSYAVRRKTRGRKSMG